MMSRVRRFVIQHEDAPALTEIRFVAQLEVVGPRGPRGWREQRVGLLRPAAHAVGHPLVVGVHLLLADGAGERPGEVGQVVADRIVVLAVERADALPAVARGVIRDADARRERPVEGEDVRAVGGDVREAFRADPEVERQVAAGAERVLHEEAQPVGARRLRAQLGLHEPVVVDAAVRIPRRAAVHEACRELVRGDRPVDVAVVQRVEGRPVRQPVHGADEAAVVAAVRRVELRAAEAARAQGAGGEPGQRRGQRCVQAAIVHGVAEVGVPQQLDAAVNRMVADLHDRGALVPLGVALVHIVEPEAPELLVLRECARPPRGRRCCCADRAPPRSRTLPRCACCTTPRPVPGPTAGCS